MEHLKDHYGQIYMIENKVNNKKYIGQTTGKNVLIDRYKNDIEKTTENKHLKASIKKYGIDNFKITLICYCETQDELNQKEKYYIDLYNTLDYQNGYNKHSGGRGGKHLEEVQKLINFKCKEFWDEHPEYKDRMSDLMSGDKNPMHVKGGHTQESRMKMSITKKEKFKNGELDLSKARAMSVTPEALEKRRRSTTKFMYVQYNRNMNELNAWYTLKEMYEYLSKNNLTHYKTYGGFKLEPSKKLVFGNLYYGYYYKIIDKEKYKMHVNTEVIQETKIS